MVSLSSVETINCVNKQLMCHCCTFRNGHIYEGMFPIPAAFRVLYWMLTPYPGSCQRTQTCSIVWEYLANTLPAWRRTYRRWAKPTLCCIQERCWYSSRFLENNLFYRTEGGIQGIRRTCFYHSRVPSEDREWAGKSLPGCSGGAWSVVDPQSRDWWIQGLLL